ncbi:MAG: hypothetical protein F2789_15935 [Actinobacteria bacterium]|nr:hypothetical protein [Actinomycetota bacterium]
MNLISDVITRSFVTHPDMRGELTEVYRASWGACNAPVQFNLVRSEPGVMRGLHMHRFHADQVMMVSGRALIGLVDYRPDSPTFGVADVVALQDSDQMVAIPVGVAHGFWIPAGGLMLYGLDVEWSTADELQCRWDDPDVHIPWSRYGDPHPADTEGGPLLSARDRAAGTLATMLADFASS